MTRNPNAVGGPFLTFFKTMANLFSFGKGHCKTFGRNKVREPGIGPRVRPNKNKNKTKKESNL
jgi:hypothetical protein